MTRLSRLLTFLLHFTITLSAQPLVFHHVQPNNSLAQSAVLQITQDSSGFLWFATPTGLSRYDSREIRTYRHQPKGARSLSSNNVRSVFCDSRGNVWVGTQTGLNLYDPESDSFTRFIHDPADRHSLSDNSIRSFAEDAHGELWIGTANGVNRMIKRGSKFDFERFLISPPGAGASRVVVNDLHLDKEGTLWAATSNGLASIQGSGRNISMISDGLGDTRVRTVCSDQAGNLWIGTTKGTLTRRYYRDGSLQNWHTAPGNGSEKFDTILKIYCDKSGQVWIGTINGLYRMDPDHLITDVFRHDDTLNGSLSDNTINYIYEDRQDLMWFGAYYGGANFIYPDYNPFKSLPLKNKTRVTAVLEDKEQNIWLNLYRDKLVKINRKGVITQEIAFDESKEEECRVIYLDGDNRLWIGKNYNELACFDPRTGRTKNYQIELPLGSQQGFHYITAILQDKCGRFWVGTSGNGLHLLNPENGQFSEFEISKHLPGAAFRRISCLYEDKAGNMMVGVRNGIVRLSAGRAVPEWLPTSNDRGLASAEATPTGIWQDAKGIIWIGTLYRGLKKYDVATKSIVNEPMPYGLSEAHIGNLVGDRQGSLWMSLDNGLVRFHPESDLVQYYTTTDGLPGNKITMGASVRLADGTIMFGYAKGAFHFDPGKVVVNTTPPEIALTNLRVFNRTVTVGGKDGLLTVDINRMEEIHIGHYQSVFTIDFATMNFRRPEKNSFAYMLEGFEDSWNYVENPSATYTNLPAGRYVFWAKGANNDGVWTSRPKKLTIVVHAPWWKTSSAYVVYLVILGTVATVVVRFFWLRGMQRKENELHQMKLDFFTNISHEIRTHLTLIGIPVRKLLSSTGSNPNELRLLRTADKNIDQLMALVNELLDFRKIESKAATLYLRESDIVAFVKNSVAAFEHLAEEKEIVTTFESKMETFTLWFDPGHMQKVMYNLLMNAYKFSPDGGRVNVTIIEEISSVHITVCDNGPGISPEYLDRLFVNFFQVYDHDISNTGYGIGLALANGIIQLHGGALTVKSSNVGPATGTQFEVVLFKGITHFNPKVAVFEGVYEPAPMAHVQARTTNDISATESQASHSVLLIEDNAELRGFCREILTTDFQVLEAADGRDGWEKAIEQIPDIIVCDVMLPGIDGFELCKNIKSDIRTSHIPVILITARATLFHQMEGLAAGADDYIPKPFHMEILGLKIKNILATKHANHRKYARYLAADNVDLETQQDSQFVKELIRMVESQAGGAALTINQFASHVGMSRSALYKKVKALTGMTVNDFIKKVLLRKASELLQEPGITVSEVAQIVGFEDVKYFSREFKKEFGRLPKEWSMGFTKSNAM